MNPTQRDKRRLQIAIELASAGWLTVGDLAARLKLSPNQVHKAIYHNARYPRDQRWFTHGDAECHPSERRHFLTELGKQAVADAQGQAVKVKAGAA